MKVYLYSRVSTDLQSTAQQERTAYEWLKAHNMQVDEVVSDEGISGGVSFADRNLGRVLLPKMNAGDVLIVSEVSRLGRSMFDLSKLIHTELKPRKIRLVCVSMGIDLRCDKMTAIDELILNNFSFAAQLEKQLISERTLSALQVKKKQGIKLGAASEKYKQTRNKHTKEELIKMAKQRGATKNARHLASREIRAFVKILQCVFGDICKGEPTEWTEWDKINTHKENRVRILNMMHDYQQMDSEGALFRNWDFSNDIIGYKLQVRLANMINSLRRSCKIASDYQETENNED